MADGELKCSAGCGKTFTYPTAMTHHALKCKGKVATRGRVARLAARQHPALPAPKVARAHRTPPETHVCPATEIVRPAPSCTTCFHGAVCVIRGRLASIEGRMREEIGQAIEGVQRDEERPTVVLVASCSLYAKAGAEA